jgi:hypothetical protein
LAKIDFTGKRNGLLVAIKFHETIDLGKRKETRWLFKCDCGNEKSLCPHDVFKIRPNTKIKGTQSCGCITHKLMSEFRIKEPGIAACNSLYSSYKKTCALNRGYDFLLTKEEFISITQQNCFYCTKEPNQIKKSKVSYYKYNGIDRVDNSKGYINGNVVSCCKECNSLKSGITKDILVKVYNFLKENGSI